MRPRALTRPARAVATGAALVGLVLSASACNAGRPPAATIEGREISAERIDDLVAAFVEADPETYGAQIEGEGEGTFRMAAVSSILGTLVLQVAQAELADREDARPTEEERTEAEDRVRNGFAPGAEAEPDPATGEPTPEALAAQETSAKVFDAISEDTRDWLVELRAVTLALARVAGEDAGDIEAQARQIYEADPTAFDALCLRAIVVENADVPAVQARLDAGEDLGAISAEVTVNPDIAAAEGSLGQCVPISQLPQFLPQPIIDVVTALDVGEVSPPNDLGDGSTAWFDVIDRQTAAFEDVQAEIEASLPDPGEAALSALVQESIGEIDIAVDPRFGTWDPETGTVIPPDGARAPETDAELIDPGPPTAPTAPAAGG